MSSAARPQRVACLCRFQVLRLPRLSVTLAPCHLRRDAIPAWTIYDMCNAVDEAARTGNIRIVLKTKHPLDPAYERTGD